MNQKLILENWRKYLVEGEEQQIENDTLEKLEDTSTSPPKQEDLSVQQQQKVKLDTYIKSATEQIKTNASQAKTDGISMTDFKKPLIDLLNSLNESKKKKSGDRCTRIAKQIGRAHV